MNCLNCDTELTQTPHKRERKFCDSTCRSNYWQKQQRVTKAIPIPPVLENPTPAQQKFMILPEKEQIIDVENPDKEAVKKQIVDLEKEIYNPPTFNTSIGRTVYINERRNKIKELKLLLK